MTYWRFTNLLTTALLIAIFTVPMPYVNDVAFGGGMVLLGMVIGREFGAREQ